MKTIAILGCGKFVEGKEGWAIGHQHAEGYLNSGHPVKLLGVDVSEENLKAFGAKFSLPPEQLFLSAAALYETVIPDCVSICTWPALHFPMCRQAIEHGVKGIFCEKPLTLDIGELRELEYLASEKNVIVTVGHQRRLEAPYRALKEAALSGRLGEPLHAWGRVGDGWDILSWTTHWFDMANFIFESTPEWVLAGMDVGSSHRYQHAIEDSSIILFQYGNHRQATFVSGPGNTYEFVVHGENGFARIRDGSIECITRDGVFTHKYDAAAPAGFTVMAKQLLDALDGGQEPGCSLSQCAMATEMAYAAQESARTSSRVTLPMKPRYAPLELAQNPVRRTAFGKRILLYADSHFGCGGREGVAAALQIITGNPPLVLDAETQALSWEDAHTCDVIAIYHTQSAVAPATKSTLLRWVAEGRPLVIIHAGLGAWPEWEDYTEWCGYIWEWNVSYHPYEAITLVPETMDPLHFGWTSAWLPQDEVFVKLKSTSPVVPGLQAQTSLGSFPAAWVNARYKNIGAWMPGHREDSWDVPAMQEGLARLIGECAGTSRSAVLSLEGVIPGE